jgi:hypothetical protein
LQGKETYPSGDIYQGEWLNDLKDGQGVLQYADGHIYDGTWKMVRASERRAFTRVITLPAQGYMHGQGIEKFADKSEYTGCVLL